MVKLTQDWQGEQASYPVGVARNRRVFLDRGATLVVIFLARVEQMAEMLLGKDHHVIEASPPDRSDQPLRESITKSSQLHLFRLIERRPSRSLNVFHPFTGVSSRS
jgi:hypothetical protein